MSRVACLELTNDVTGIFTAPCGELAAGSTAQSLPASMHHMHKTSTRSVPKTVITTVLYGESDAYTLPKTTRRDDKCPQASTGESGLTCESPQ